MKLPIKWRLYVSANVFLLLGVISLLTYSSYIIFNEEVTLDRLSLKPLVTGSYLVMLFNYCFNLSMVRKHFPDKLVPPLKKTLNLVLFGLNAIVWGFLQFRIMMGLPHGITGTEDSIALLVALLVEIAMTFVLILQFRFPAIVAGNENSRQQSGIGEFEGKG